MRFIFLLVFLGIFVLALPAFAALQVNWPPSPLGTQLTETSNLTNMIRYFYEWAIFLGGLAAFVSLVIAGFQYLTSTGDPMKMRQAIDRIKNAGLGLGLLLAAVLILNTINPRLTQLKEPSLPTLSAENWLTDDQNYEGLFQKNQKSCEDGSVSYVTVENVSDLPTGPTDGCKKSFSEGAVTIKSITIENNAACQVNLYQLADCDITSDAQMVTVNSSISDIGGTYGTNVFRSIWIKDVSIK